MNLKEFGWMLMQSEEKIESIARITCVHKNICNAISESGSLNIHLSGKFHFNMNSAADKPATGDFIRISPPFNDEQNSKAAVLIEILPRRSKISRLAAGTSNAEQVLVSNIDYAFIVTSANDDFSINRLQRFILLAREGCVQPVIILSKIDLLQNPENLTQELVKRIDGVEVIPVSCMQGIGIEKVRNKLKTGSTSVFLGSSGVGKSTIVNALLGENIQETLEVREEDSKGRHTTTSRELFFIPNGGMFIDTAGLREVQVLAGNDAVISTFTSITELENECKFTNCSHKDEPECAVNDALKSGSLLEEEYQSFLKLKKEAAYAEIKTDKAKPSNAKKKWKQIHKNYQARKKFEGKS